MKPPRTPLVVDLDSSALSKPRVARDVTVTPKLPQVPRQQLGARIPVDVYKRLRMRAVMEDVLVQELIERAIVEFLDRGERPAA